MENIGKFIGPVLSVVGTLAVASGEASAGSAANASAEFQAAQLTQQAGQARASAQRAAMEARRQGRLKASAAQARGAASGAGGHESLVADIAAESEFAALVALHNGEEVARGMETQANAARITGKSKQSAGQFEAFTTLLSGASTMFLRFGQDDEDDDE